MSQSEYFEHKLSPFIFQIKDIPFEKLSEPVPLGITLVAILVLGVALWFAGKRKDAEGNTPSIVASLQSIFWFALVAFGGMFAAYKANFSWGLRWYSTMYLVSFVFFYFSCKYWIRHRVIMMSQLQLDSLLAYAILGMILGARTAYVFIYNWADYQHKLGDAIKVWEGGLSFHGGIVGVVTAILIFCKRNKIPFWHLTDKICLAVPFGIGMGRIGNFMNGELFGRIIQGNVPCLCEGWLLLLTLHVINKFPSRHRGSIATSFVFFYGIYRYFIEFFREADEQLKYYFNNTTTMGQILCVITSLIGVVLYFAVVRNNPKVDSAESIAEIEDYIEKRKVLEAQSA
jgi:phosphatidylglycerol---prolipoprotein diacylglyceryl transferase